MFISFEGIDGSGKSTQARLLAETLEARGEEVLQVREPGGTALGERIRSLLLDPASSIRPRAELLLFSAARAQLVEEAIAPTLARGAVVIADRFYDSSTAYQGAGRSVAEPDAMRTLHAFVTAGLSPDRTYFIDVPLEVATHRRGGRDLDRMESGGDAFFERVRAGYLSLAAASPARIVTLDGTRPVDALRDMIASDVLARLDA